MISGKIVERKKTAGMNRQGNGGKQEEKEYTGIVRIHPNSAI